MLTSNPAMRRLAICIAAAAAIVAFAPRIAWAHAIVVSAQPAMNAMVPPGPLEVRLDFNSRIDVRRSELMLVGPDATERSVGVTKDTPPGVLAAHAQVDAAGPWVLRWQVLSLDGHITRGEVRFSVRAADGSH
jgi:methionine-rich copper-binding protein CopC